MKKIFKIVAQILACVMTLGINVNAISFDDIMVSDLEKYTPEAYTFRIKNDNKTYILLDENIDENSSFLLLGKDSFGDVAFDLDASQVLNYDSENNIGHFLNTTCKDAINEKIGKALIAPIDLLNGTQWKKYCTKIGYDDNITTTNGWWLNEPVDEYENSVHYVSKNGKVLMETSSNTLAIRPLFRVGHEFFKNTQLDVDYMGVCVKEMLFNNFS
ncbi:MAG: hypothetical protein RR957_02400, partial [Oscillospiraceae bacterium]